MKEFELLRLKKDVFKWILIFTFFLIEFHYMWNNATLSTIKIFAFAWVFIIVVISIKESIREYRGYLRIMKEE